MSILMCARRLPSLNAHLVAVFLLGVTDIHMKNAANHVDPRMSDGEVRKVVFAPAAKLVESALPASAV